MPNRNASSPTDPQVLTLFQEELARATALPSLSAAGPALWPRFAGYYQGLARLPRRLRRALQRRWRRSLGGIALLCALGQAPALAATINVGAGCTLVDAITAANTNQPTGGCPAGSGADTFNPSGLDTITLPSGSTQTLTSVNNGSVPNENGLPVVSSAIVIDGNGSTIARDPAAPDFRILAVNTAGNLTLQETTITGGSVSGPGTFSQSGGGVINGGTLTLANSTVSGNFADRGGGVENDGTLVVASSAVSGNSAYYDGGGVFNSGTATLTNSTVSGNSANSRAGGGLYNYGTLTLTNSTVTGNSASDDGGGIYNRRTLTLVQTLVSGNSAGSQGPEVHNYTGEGSGTVNADYFNLFGYDGSSGVTGFTPEMTDIVPSVPLAAILDPTLGNNGGPTRTHALVIGSPAIDAVLAAACATTSDQRDIGRPQDGDEDTVADCDIGAFEVAETPPGADLSLTNADSPDPVVVGKPLAYTLTVRNNGPDSATGVTVRDFLPGSVSLVSATPSQGSCSGTSTVSCALGSLANGTTATVTIVVIPTSAGALSNTANVTGSPNDPNPDDNSDTETTTVNPSPPPNAVPVSPNPQLGCTGSTCRVPIKCDAVPGTSCNIEVRIFVPARTIPVRLNDDPAARAQRRRLFAFGVANIPAGQIANVKLKLRKAGRQIARTSMQLRIRGVMEIRNSAGTVSSTRIRIRLK